MAPPYITETATAIPLLRHRDTVSTPADQDDFVNKYEATNDHLSNNTIGEFNTIGTEINTLADWMDTTATSISADALTAQAAANYKGNWSILSPDYPYSLGVSVSNSGSRYASKVNSNTEEPVAESANWALLPETGITAVVDDTTPELGGDLDGKGKSIYGTTIKTVTALTMNISTHDQLIATLTTDASVTFTSIPTGSSDWIVEFTAAGFTPTWDVAVEWDGDGTEPTWTAGTDTIYFKTVDGGTTIQAMRTRAGA